MKKEDKAFEKIIEKLMKEPAVLYDEDNNKHVFKTVGVINLEEDNNIYFLVEPVEPNDNFGEDEVLVLKFVDDENMVTVMDEEIIKKVIDEYNKIVEKNN